MRRYPILAAVLLLACSTAVADSSQVRLTWQNSTQTTMSVTWRSTEASGQVDYGADTSYGATAAATTTSYGGSYLHTAELTGLKPNTAYHYRCGTGSTWSADYTFKTAPPPGTPFRFVAWGDSRSNNAARAQVRAAIAARQPTFSVTTGDLVESGTNQSQWDEWFATMEPLTAVAPTFTIVGNHEGDVSQYFTQWPMPTHPTVSGYHDRAFYSFDYGNVHLIGLDSNANVGGAQLTWLEKDLAAASARPEIRWIVVFAHHPPYSSGSHGSDLEVRNTWNPLFEKYGVDLAFWAHDHHYERSKPMKNGSPAAAGTTYVVTGGAGAPLYSAGTSSWTAFSKSLHHFVELNVEQNTLTLEARDISGNVFDSMTLSKTPVDAPAPGTDPGDTGTPPAGGGSSPGVEPAPGSGGSGCSAAGAGTVLLPMLGFLGLAVGLRRRRR